MLASSAYLASAAATLRLQNAIRANSCFRSQDPAVDEALTTFSRLPYDDGTPLFISLVEKKFSLAIYDVQSTVSLDSASMSSNYIIPNPSKTEFLVIDLPQ